MLLFLVSRGVIELQMIIIFFNIELHLLLIKLLLQIHELYLCKNIEK